MAFWSVWFPFFYFTYPIYILYALIDLDGAKTVLEKAKDRDSKPQTTQTTHQSEKFVINERSLDNDVNRHEV